MSPTELTLHTPTGDLVASVDLPSVDPPWPFVLLLAGSGPTDRDGLNPLSPERVDNLRQIGSALAARGIAVVRPDKRGIGASAAAAPSEEEMTFDRLVADAVDWLDLVRDDGRCARLVAAGHSEGALIATLAAGRRPVDGLVTLSGPGRPAGDVLREQLRSMLPPDLLARAEAVIDSLEQGNTVDDPPAELAALFRPSVQPYLMSWLSIDPMLELSRSTPPVLVVHGADDAQVPVSDAHLLASAAPGSRTMLLPGVDHLLRVPPATTVDPGVIDSIAAFVGRTCPSSSSSVLAMHDDRARTSRPTR